MTKSKGEKTPGSGKRKALIVLVTVLAVILALLLAVTIFVETKLSSIRRPEDQETLSSEEIESILQETESVDPDYTGPTMSKDDVSVPTGPVDEIGKDNIVNILLVGQDARNSVRAHSDAMILCTVDRSKGTLTMTSFLRDMYMHIPGFGKQRLNVSYMVGGFPMLDNTLKENFGIVVDHNIEVNFEAFQKVIDILGGVDIELTRAEANHLAGQGFRLTEGTNHLNGEQALAYARIRKIDYDGDFSRTKRQRAVMNAVIEQAKTLDVGTMLNMVDAILPYVVVDMSNSEIISMVKDLGPLLPSLTVVNQRIPADGTYKMAMIDGMSVLLPDFAKNQQILKDTLGS